MTTNLVLVLFGILLLGLGFTLRLFRIRYLNKSRFLVFFLNILFYFLINLYLYFLRTYLASWLGLCLGICLSFWIFHVSDGAIIPYSSPDNSPSSSSTTISIPSSNEQLSPSQVGPPNAEPEENILSQFGMQDPVNMDREFELYARIRLLESRLLDRLPPQLNPGEYENLVRANLNQSFNLNHYHAALSHELFDITILELKANFLEEILNLFLAEPDDRFRQIIRDSIFNEGDIRTEILNFLEEKIEAIDLSEPRSQFERALLKTSLNHWSTHLREHRHGSIIYIGFLAHFRGGG